ncbi:acetyltransferase [Arcticibacter svalbardensis MN12-7]|uniref:Acetyltransferase n=1 Tax=Arcticibacter svalbardensis MN12-7 TaxID=1150600 RepID=R9GR33_9SPHI|nr:acyltransferase [Arcticibacter svalbardensis]EOR94015.1 acetyltransferase [Arcticibacter svalbardensis MN12-7]
MKKGIYLKIYFSFFGKVVSYLMNIIGAMHKPFMVYGFYNKVSNDFNLRTRISSSAKFLSRSKADISDNVWIWHYSIIDASAGLSIEEGVQIGAWVGIFTHSSHNAIRLNGSKYFELAQSERVGYSMEKVIIGKYTFIGASSIILPGVTLGKGCIVSAGSVVNKSFPDYSIISGNPAKLVGSTETVDKYFLKNESIKSNYYNC